MVYNSPTVNNGKKTMSQKYECSYCEGGTIDLYISGEYQETIDCPECNATGYLNKADHEKAQDCIGAFRTAMAGDNGCF